MKTLLPALKLFLRVQALWITFLVVLALLAIEIMSRSAGPASSDVVMMSMVIEDSQSGSGIVWLLAILVAPAVLITAIVRYLRHRRSP